MEDDSTSMPASFAELVEMREELELDIRQWFLDTDSDFTFEDVLEVVFEEEDRDDLQQIIMMFDDGDPLSMSTAIELATDAWNYFPHRALGGKSPAELLLAQG